MTRPTVFDYRGRKVNVTWTRIDRLVDYLSPGRGDKRYQSRVRQGISASMYGGGGYTSADGSRPANIHGNRAEMDADSAILPDLERLREDSQHLARNNCIAGGALSTNVTRVIGNGLFPKPKINRKLLNISDEQADAFEEAAEQEYIRVTETREFDVERSQPFSVWQSLAFLSVLRDGDCLVNLPRFARGGSDAMLKVQLIQSARISNPQYKQDTRRMVAGVTKDTWGAAVKYHVSNHHPGNRSLYLVRGDKQAKWQTLRAFDDDGSPLCLHLFDKKMPGQTRGVPYLAPVIELLRQLGRYTDAEVMAAVISGMFTVFVESQSGDIGLPHRSNDVDEVSNEQIAQDLKKVDLDIGAAIALPDGKTIKIAESKRPSQNFDPFFLAITNQIAIALEIPGEVLMKRFTSSYSAARGALEDAWCYFLRRRNWMVKMLCHPVYEQVIAEAVAYGRLSAPGFYRSDAVRAAWCGAYWQGDAKPVIDESKTVKAAVDRIEARISSIDEESRKLTGTPFEDKLPQIIKERRLLAEAGLDPDYVFSGGGTDE